MAAAPAAAAQPATARQAPAAGRFRVVGPSYGKVLRGVDTHTGRAVAIKAVAEGRMRPGALEREVAVISGFSAGAAGITRDTAAAGGEAGAPAGPAHPKTHANIAQLVAYLPVGSHQHSEVRTDQGTPLPDALQCC